MKRLILAIQFLTVFPVKRDIEARPEDLSASMAYFPLVGALQGAVLVGTYLLFSTLLPDSVVMAIALLALVLTNGGLHLDGFADTVDGLAGGNDAGQRLKIMRDSSIGAIGVVFLVLDLLIKYLALREMPAEVRLPALFMFPAIGRWAMVPMAALSTYARSEGGVGAAFAGNGVSTALKATLLAGALLTLSAGALSLVIMAALGAVVYFMSRYFRRKLGGVTGDVFGFTSEAGETLFLVMLLAL
ncbi:MAG: adenosylcobinamide-GDP ribazoletransferase, partial [Deltaproteobacteria bacterium]